MTYPTNKQHKLVKHGAPDQKGVTLLLAILILSSVMAISFSLATILLVEVRTSGDLARTEPALYGAHAVTEEALFKIKRRANNSQFPTYSNTVSYIALNNTSQDYADPIQQIKIPPNRTLRYSLHDPNNMGGPSNYNKVKLTYLVSGSSSSGITVWICELDPANPPSDPNNTCQNLSTGNPVMIVKGSLLRPSMSTLTTNLNPNYQQEIILVNSESDYQYVKMETWDSGNNPKGVPYFAEKAVDINANNSGVSRKVRVIVPVN